MAHTFTTTEKNRLSDAINLMLKAQATELPFDATVIERVATVAVSSGFVASNGTFLERAKLNPISTLLQFAAYLGAP